MKRIFTLCLVLIAAAGFAMASGASEGGEDLSLQKVIDKGTFVLGLDDASAEQGAPDVPLAGEEGGER